MNVELHTEQGVKVIVPLVRRLDASVASAFKQQGQIRVMRFRWDRSLIQNQIRK